MQPLAGPSSGSNRVKRGGSWNNNANNCSVANRNNNNPDNRNNNLGFRVVCSAQHTYQTAWMCQISVPKLLWIILKNRPNLFLWQHRVVSLWKCPKGAGRFYGFKTRKLLPGVFFTFQQVLLLFFLNLFLLKSFLFLLDNQCV